MKTKETIDLIESDVKYLAGNLARSAANVATAKRALLDAEHEEVRDREKLHQRIADLRKAAAMVPIGTPSTPGNGENGT